MNGPRLIRTLLPLLVIASVLAVPLPSPAAESGDPDPAALIGATPSFRLWGVFNATGVNVTNSQVDVGSDVWFNVTVGITTLADLDLVIIRGWYDDGDPLELAGTTSYNQTTGRNLNFELRWLNTTGTSTFSIQYPDADHLTLVSFAEQVTSAVTIALSWRVNFGGFFRWSPGDAGCPSFCGDGAWTLNPTPRVKATSFNDLNSFNLRLTAVDSLAFSDTVWDEFGFYRHSELLIGGDPFGFGTPGGSRIALSTSAVPSTPTNVSYVSNAPHRMAIEITDAINGTETISADQIGIRGGQIIYDTAFNGAASPLYVNGSSTSYSVAADNPYPPEAGGAYDYGETEWFLTIPAGTPSGTYIAAITYNLETNTDPNGISTVPESFDPPVLRTIRVGSTTVGLGDVTYQSGTGVEAGNLVQLIDATDGTTVYASWTMGDGTDTGPPLFVARAGEFDTSVSLDPDLFPFLVRVRVFDTAGGCSSVFGDSDPFIITAITPTYDLTGWDLERSC